jgi:hypothetical protein
MVKSTITHDETTGEFQVTVSATTHESPDEVKSSFSMTLDGIFMKSKSTPAPVETGPKPSPNQVKCVKGICRDSGIDWPTLWGITELRFGTRNPNMLSMARIGQLTDMLRTQEPDKNNGGKRFRPTSDLLDSEISNEQLIAEGRKLRQGSDSFPTEG